MFIPRIEIEREIRPRVYAVRSPCAQRVFRLRDFEIQLKGNILLVFRQDTRENALDTHAPAVTNLVKNTE